MAKKKVKKGAKLVCVPCGREVTINSCGMSQATIWCCKKPMKKRTAFLVKKIKAKTHKKKR